MHKILQNHHANLSWIWKLTRFTHFIPKVFATKILLSGKFSPFLTLQSLHEKFLSIFLGIKKHLILNWSLCISNEKTFCCDCFKLLCVYIWPGGHIHVYCIWKATHVRWANANFAKTFETLDSLTKNDNKINFPRVLWLNSLDSACYLWEFGTSPMGVD